MNKRQRKKRQRKESRRFWSLMDDPDLDQFIFQSPWITFSDVNTIRFRSRIVSASPTTVIYSTVQDPDSWGGYDSGILDIVSPSQDRCNYQYLSGRGFARIFSGDQSRRDRFPSPYLPDGKENPEYAGIIDDGLIPSRLPEDEDHSYEQMARRYYGWP